MANTQALIPVKASALAAMASRFDMEPLALMNTLKNTVFKGATNEQLAALVIVANEHRLNPFTREIYAFPDKSGGIQAVIGVDGWIRIITTNPKFDGVEFKTDAESCTCIMHVKERSHPVTVTEYLTECRRNTEPWRTHPKRMLRHKALIQAGRIAFGLGSLKDEDDVTVMAHPASATVRPVFGALPEQTEPEPAPEQTSPSDTDDGAAQVDSASAGAANTATQTPKEASPGQPISEEPPQTNYLKGLRSLLKLANHTEAELLQWMREFQNTDESLSSLEEIAMVSPTAVKTAYDEWKTVDTAIRTWKASAGKKAKK